jgi:monoamine oxidase
LATGIRDLLPRNTVQQSTPISSITDQGTHVEAVSSAAVRYHGRKLILSVPTPLCKDIQFSPPLPATKLVASTSTKLGYYTKVIAVYDRPWWADSGSCGLALSYQGPVVVARDTSSPADHQFSLTCFVNGSIGRRWSQKSASD